MIRKRDRQLFTALSMAAAIGLFSCFSTTEANAQQTTTETTEEQDTAAELANLQELIASLSAALEAIRAELEVFKQEREDTQQKSLTLRLPLGLSRSTATAETFYSRRPADDEVICTAIGCAPDGPLEDLLLFSAENRLFAPLTSTLRSFYGDQSSMTRTDDFYIETFSADGSGGFNVNYVVDGGERLVHFGSDDYGSENCKTCYYKQDEEGRRYWFWDWSEGLDYADIYGGFFHGDRHYFVFGARTETGSLPAGMASYFGRMRAEAYKRDDPDLNQRVEMAGRIVLTADLDESTLDGVIRTLQSRPRGGQWSAMSDTSAHFNITGGNIVDGQFTATLTGMGDEDAEADDTVRGYKGGILGEFYGPAAEEFGGVVSATSNVHDRVLGGHISGTQLDSSVPEGDLSILSVALDRDHSEPGVGAGLSTTAEVTAIASDNAGGFRVTYSVDGEEQEIHLGARDYGAHPVSPSSYYERIDDRSYWFWNPASYSLVPEYDYFDVRAWSVTDEEVGGTAAAALTAARRGFAVYGSPTETSDLPSTTASYSGRVYAETHLVNDPEPSTARGVVRGSLTLNANFGTSTVSGMIDEVEYRAAGQSSYAASDGHMTIGSGAIADSGFTADLTGTQDFANFTGDMDGQFYGPEAAEVGGVLEGTHSTENFVLTGYFGGTKQ